MGVWRFGRLQPARAFQVPILPRIRLRIQSNPLGYFVTAPAKQHVGAGPCKSNPLPESRIRTGHRAHGARTQSSQRVRCASDADRMTANQSGLRVASRFPSVTSVANFGIQAMGYFVSSGRRRGWGGRPLGVAEFTPQVIRVESCRGLRAHSLALAAPKSHPASAL